MTATAPKPPPPLKVLLIEDDEATARALRVLFHQRSGLDVLWAASLAEGRALLTESPDCVLLDLMLPDGEGIEILEEIRDRDSLAPRVVVVTAMPASSKLVKRAVALCPDAILHKPYEIDGLVAAIKGEPFASAPLTPR